MIGRMMRFGTVAGATTLLMASPLDAQRALTVNIGGGVSFPQGQLGRGHDVGWHALGALSLGSVIQPMGLRLEGTFSQFDGADDGVEADSELSVVSVTLNTTYRLPMVNSPVSPYMITGLGGHSAFCSGPASCDRATRFGWNAGLGMRFAAVGLRGFVEARYHATARGTYRSIPVTLGLTF